MLSTDALEHLLDEMKVPAAGKELVLSIRSEEPTRRVRSGPNNAACRYPSRKMNGATIQAESHRNELAAVWYWDHDDLTYEFYDQPPSIPLRYAARNGRAVSALHTPDYFRIAADYIGYVECKDRGALEQLAKKMPNRYLLDDDGQWRCPPGEAFAKSFGLSYTLRLQEESDPIVVRNIRFLSDYVDAPAVGEEVVATVLALFRERAWYRLADLVAGENSFPSDAIYKMIWDQIIYADLAAEPIAELQFAILYKDQSACAIHQKINRSTYNDLFRSSPIKIEAGQSIVWDGNPWTILNAGLEQICLQGKVSEIINVSRHVLEELVKKGVITGLREEESPSDKLAAKIITKAGQSSKTRATEITKLLLGDKATALQSISRRTYYYWQSKFRKAESEYGSGYIGVIPRYWERGNRHQLADAVVTIISEVFTELRVKGNSSITLCYGEIIVRCEERGYPSPSEKSVRHHFHILEDHEAKAQRIGEKAAYSSKPFVWYLDQDVPRHGDRPFDVGHIDSTCVSLRYVDRETRQHFAKAWLTILMDAWPRKVLAFYLSFDAPSYRSSKAVLRLCIKIHGRAPKTLVSDQGAEFYSDDFEAQIAFLKCIKLERPASAPRYGSVCERLFGVTEEQLIHNLEGNNAALQTPRSMSPSHDPRGLAVWTLDTFAGKLGDWFENCYGNLIHSALGETPNEAFSRGKLLFGTRAHALTPYNTAFQMISLPTTSKGTAEVNSASGIKVLHLHYYCEHFKNPKYHGRSYPVRYEPFDRSRAYLYLDGEWRLCLSELAPFFSRRSEQEVKRVTDEMSASFKAQGKRRHINAKAIALWMRATRDTEAALRRQKVDAENSAALDAIEREDAASDGQSHESTSDVGVDKPGLNDTLTTPPTLFGEYK